MAKNYPLAKPYLTKKDKKSVLEVLDSGRLSLGPKYKIFEKEFARKIGVKYACAVSSGTAGLHLVMLAAGIKAGDEVITTPFSFVASANCILYVGAKPVFVDIDPLTYNIDPKRIEEKITKKTKAILVVHIFGQPADMDAILKIAKRHHLKIIEDACESVRAAHKGKSVGTFGESAVFAFYPNKQMTTGEGGMIVTNKKKIYDLCCALRNQGRSENMQWLEHKYLGYNYRMDEMSAALGLAQLERLDFSISERQKICSLYDKYLSAYSDLIQIPYVAPGNTHTRFVYVIKIKEKNISRDKVIKVLSRLGISTKPYLPSIHLFDFYRKQYHYKRGDFLVSEETSEHSLALPLYIGLKEKDIVYISQKLVRTIELCSRAARKQRVLVVGGTGFIGSHLVKKLKQRRNVAVSVIHLNPVSEDDKEEGVIYHQIDASQPNPELRAVLAASDFVVLATQPNPKLVKNFIALSSRAEKLKKVLYISSILLYADSPRRQKENARLRPRTEYERLKLKEEKLLRDFSRSHSAKVCLVRLTNVYGGIKNRGVVGLIFQSLLKDKFFVINGDGSQNRDYLFIDDAVAMLDFLIFAKQSEKVDLFNVSSGQNCTIKDLIFYTERIIRRKIPYIIKPANNEKRDILADNEKILRKSKYHIKYDILTGLRKAYKNYLIPSYGRKIQKRI